MKTIFYACLVTVAVLGGCSSGKSTFERGNYYEAVITSVSRLRKNDDHKKSVETLQQAYPMAVAFFEDRAKTSLASAERFKWSEVVKSYAYINTMYDEIKRCPGALAVIPNPVNYFSRLQQARQNAAEEHYAAGILSLQGNTRQSAKEAYGYFKAANEYVVGYKEVNDYLAAALAAATVKIVVEPIPVYSKSVGVSADFFNDKISEFVHAAPINEFVKFYTRAEAKKIKLDADHIIQLQFDDFTVGEIYKHEKEIQLTKDSVVMGTYVSPSTAGAQNQNSAKTDPSARNGLVVNGTAVVASTGTPVNAAPPAPANTQNTATDHERAAKELAEKRLREQREAEQALADKLRAERESAERDRASKEAAERAAMEAAEQQRIAKAAEDKAAADKAQADHDRAERERAERERIEREQLEKLNADKERAAREQAENERLAAEAAKAQAAKEREEEDKAGKEKIAKEIAEREKAEKEKAEKEKEDKGKLDKAIPADPYIAADDTLNVTDPVYICHSPPGNKLNSRTLKINRAALKAHLAHGDMEGTCETEKKEEKGKPAGNEKEKPEDVKTKPQDNKGKGPGGSASVGEDNASSFLNQANQVMIASANRDAASIFRYLVDTKVETDTNKVYGTVKATLYHHTKTTTSKGVVSFRIIDAKTGALLSSEKMPGEFVWRSEWATFNGDERALSADQIRLSKLKELPAPAPQDLFIEFTRPIYDQITAKIRDFYKGY